MKIIIIGSCKSEKFPCGVAYFTKDLIAHMIEQKCMDAKSISCSEKGWSLIDSIYIIRECIRAKESIILANFNTRMYSRSILIRITILTARLLRLSRLVTVMHEDLLASRIQVAVNINILISDTVIINRPLRQLSKRTQNILSKKDFRIIENPPMCAKKLEGCVLEEYNKIRERNNRNNEVCKIGLFGLVSTDKGFDNAMNVISMDESLQITLFSDLKTSNENEEEYKRKLLSEIERNKEQVVIHGRIDELASKDLQGLGMLDIALFPYRKDAGLWNTTLSMCNLLNIPIIAVNKKERSGWNLTKTIYYIECYSVKAISSAIREVRNSDYTRDLLKRPASRYEVKTYIQIEEILRTVKTFR